MPLRKLDPIRLWDWMFFRKEHRLTLAWMRIAVGCVIVCQYLILWRDWTMYFGPDSATGLAAENPYANSFYFGRDIFSLTAGWIPMTVHWWIGILAALAFCVGYQTRVATVILFLYQVSMTWQSPMAINGEDLVLKFILFWSIFLPLGAERSLDSLRLGRFPWEHRIAKPPNAEFEVWPLHMIRFSLCLVYFVSTYYKLVSDPAWVSGDAIYWVAQNETWFRFPGLPIFETQAVSWTLTLGSLLIEGLFAFAILFPGSRRIWIPLTFLFQIVLALTINNVALFSLSMAAGILCFLSDSDIHHYKVILRKLKQSFREKA